MLQFRPAIIALAFLTLLFQASGALAGPSLVFEAETGRIVSSEGEREPWHPASLTKLMTGYVTFLAIKAGRFSLDSEIHYSENAAAQPPSRIGLRPGSALKLDVALQGMLIRSANDFAVAIAENVGGSVAEFAKMMNETARRLGMANTYFANPHGLPDIRQTTTARDLGILSSAIIRDFPEYQPYFSAPSVTVGNRQFSNRNGLLRQMKTADGMKTGYICSSGYNLIASATQDGRRLVAVVLGAKSGGSRTAIARSLLEKGFEAPVSGRTLDKINPGALSSAPAPADMTAEVCTWKPPYEVTKTEDLRDWGVAFGRAASPQEATSILNEWLLATRYVFYGGRGVFTRVPYKGDYLVMVDQLDQRQSRTVCGYLRANGAACQVMSPEMFQALIRETEQEIAEGKPSAVKIEAAGGPVSATPQGNDNAE